MMQKEHLNSILIPIVDGILKNHTDVFLVDLKISTSNEITLLIDSDTFVNIEMCIKISKELEEVLETVINRETDDFELTVSSFGIGYPMSLLRQIKKIKERDVEVKFKNGEKKKGFLLDVKEDVIALAYTKKEFVEGKKRKQDIEYVDSYEFNLIDSIKEIF